MALMDARNLVSAGSGLAKAASGLAVGLLLAGAGCAGPSEVEVPGLVTGIFAPRIPEFLRSPASILFTNGPGFSARVLETGGKEGTRVAGALLGHGTMLLFAPDPDEMETRQKIPTGFSFLWDVSKNSGYLVSETLQGYAPLSLSGSAPTTNLVIHETAAAPAKIEGQTCQPATLVATANDGSNTAFEVWRAKALNNLPLRIASVTNPVPFAATLSKVRVLLPEAELFVPPEGFVRYSSPEAMADEMSSRHRNLKRKSYSGVEAP